MEDLLEMIGEMGSASGAASNLRTQLAALQASQRLVGDGSIELHDQILRQQQAMDQLAAAMPALIAAEKAAAKAADEQAKAYAKSDEAQRKVTASVNAAGGPVASLTSKLKQFAEASSTSEGRSAMLASGIATVASVAASAAAAVVAAVVTVSTAIVVGFGTAIIKGAELAIEMTEARAKIAATWSALAGGKAAGAEALATIAKLSKDLPYTSAQLREMGEGFLAAGFKGKALENAIRGVAAAEAIRAGGGAAAEKMIRTLGEGGKAAETMGKTISEGGRKAAELLTKMGLSAADVAEQFGGKIPKGIEKTKGGAEKMAVAIEKALAKKGKGPLDEMMGSWPVIIAKAREGFMSLFSGLGPAVKPFMAAVKELFGQFNKGKPITNSLKAGITSALGAVFKYGTMAVKAISAFIKTTATAKNIGKVFAAIKTAIVAVAGAVGTVIGWIKRFTASSNAMAAVKYLFITIGAVILVAAVSFGVFVGFIAVGVGLIVGAIALVIAIVVKVAGVIAKVPAAAKSAFAKVKAAITGAFKGISLGAIASNLIKSLISGVGGMVGQVAAAFARVGGAAKAALKAALGIASPSKVGLEVGQNVGESTAAGADKSVGKVKAAAARVGKAATPEAGGAGGKGGRSITFTGCNFYGTQNQADIDRMLDARMEREAASGPEAEPS